jgi:hypothetical protein
MEQHSWVAPQEPLQAVMFAMDATLAATEPLRRQAWQAAASLVIADYPDLRLAQLLDGRHPHCLRHSYEPGGPL